MDVITYYIVLRWQRDSLFYPPNHRQKFTNYCLNNSNRRFFACKALKSIKTTVNMLIILGFPIYFDE